MRSWIPSRRSCSPAESSGRTNENISTLSNWCTRKIVRHQDLARMQRRQRDLRRADEEELVARDLVDHLPLAGEEPRPEERSLAYEDRGDDRGHAFALEQGERKP